MATKQSIPVADPVDPDAPACCTPLDGPLLDEAEAEEMALVMKALADPVRLRLLSLIANSPTGETCACDLATPLGRSQPTVSHHLTLLTKAGLIEREQRGKWAWFRARADRLAEVSDAVRLGARD
ncbi:MAG: helix-turn-helix transcriptional regulator [Actinomycetia bacterium]|nr:helix-turn-helix transcriptional regulator [Actinomycetes bacterium]